MSNKDARMVNIRTRTAQATSCRQCRPPLPRPSHQHHPPVQCRRSGTVAYIAALALSLSVFLFASGDGTLLASASGSPIGIFLLLISIFSDSFVGVYEEKAIFGVYEHAEPAEVLMWSYLLSSIGSWLGKGVLPLLPVDDFLGLLMSSARAETLFTHVAVNFPPSPTVSHCGPMSTTCLSLLIPQPPAQVA